MYSITTKLRIPVKITALTPPILKWGHIVRKHGNVNTCRCKDSGLWNIKNIFFFLNNGKQPVALFIMYCVNTPHSHIFHSTLLWRYGNKYCINALTESKDYHLEDHTAICLLPCLAHGTYVRYSFNSIAQNQKPKPELHFYIVNLNVVQYFCDHFKVLTRRKKIRAK